MHSIELESDTYDLNPLSIGLPGEEDEDAALTDEDYELESDPYLIVPAGATPGAPKASDHVPHAPAPPPLPAQHPAPEKTWSWREFFMGVLYTVVLFSAIGGALALGVIAVNSRSSKPAGDDQSLAAAGSKDAAKQVKAVASEPLSPPGVEATKEDARARAERELAERVEREQALKAARERAKQAALEEAEEAARKRAEVKRRDAQAREEVRKREAEQAAARAKTEKGAREDLVRAANDVLAAYESIQSICYEHERAWDSAERNMGDAVAAIERSLKRNAMNLQKSERQLEDCGRRLDTLENGPPSLAAAHGAAKMMLEESRSLIAEAKRPSGSLADYQSRRLRIHDSVTQAHDRLAKLLPK